VRFPDLTHSTLADGRTNLVVSEPTAPAKPVIGRRSLPKRAGSGRRQRLDRRPLYKAPRGGVGREQRFHLAPQLAIVAARTADEPLPDLSIFPPEIMQYTSPLGTHFDAFPLHVLTTASLAALGRHAPDAHADVRRFRPNLLIEPSVTTADWVEIEWCGKRLRIGSAQLTIEMPCVRCVMPTLPQPELPKEPSVLRTIVREAGQNLGVYATVAAPGAVVVGDAVELLD